MRQPGSKKKKSQDKQGGHFRKQRPVKRSSNEKKRRPDPKPGNPDLIRLNRFIANAGICTRREADTFIAAGSVTVNGKPVTEMGHKVKPSDTVRFDGRVISAVKKEYVLLNKPKDFSVTVRNQKGKRTVLGLISSASKNELKPVDKLHTDSTGLLLFTNDGHLEKKLANPKNGLRKVFHVELDRALRSADLKAIQEGVTIDQHVVKVRDISFIDKAPKSQVGIEIHSTRSNIVRRLFAELDYQVIKLDRVVYGPLTKKDLPRGHWRYLTEQEVINLGMIK